jgi:3-oxoacyl-[acyl-carrier protein] reductase
VSTDQRVALVTGAGRGIGRFVATRLAASGYRVSVAARTADQLAEVAAETGALPIELDVTGGAAVTAAVARVEAELGPVTLLVNNAGIAGPNKVSWEIPAATWWSVFEVNVLGAFLCSQAVLPGMVAAGAGRIVNLSSNAAFFRVDEEPFCGINSAYMSSKVALARFSDALAAEARPHGVTVFAISPGTVKSDMSAGIFAAEWDDPEFPWSPPDLTADLVEFIDTGALDALSGRYLHAANDDWRGFADRIAELLADDLHVVRLRT